MIKPDKPAAIDKIKHLHEALDGVLMCVRNGGITYNLVIGLRDELRQILRLLGEEEK